MGTAKTLVGRGFPRYFAMARHSSWGSGPSGWYVCDGEDLDKTHLAKPLHDDPMTEVDARELAEEMNQ
jgi:hypothetical protein